MMKYVLILLIFFFLSVPAISDVYYVDQNHASASDDNAGTEALPWETIQKACATLTAGDTVVVKAGVYSDPNAISVGSHKAFNPTNSGSNGNPIIFQSSPQGAAVIRSRNYPNNDYISWGIDSKSYIILDGFKVEGGIRISPCNHIIVKNIELTVGYYPPTDPSLNWGIAIHGSTYCTVENNYVHDMADSGNHLHNSASIMLFGNCDYSIIQNNLADNSNGYIFSAFGQKGGGMDYCVWRYNIAQHSICGFLGMASTDGTILSTNNIFYQNIIVNCDRAFELDHGCEYFKIYNNTSYTCPLFFKAIRNDNTDTELWNNIAVGSDKAIRWSGYPDALPFSTILYYSDYNDFYTYSIIGYREKTPTLTYTTLLDWQNATSFDTNSIISNPNFVNTIDGNFHLQTGSPCELAGIDRQDYNNNLDTTENINLGCYIVGDETIGLTTGWNKTLTVGSGTKQVTTTGTPTKQIVFH